jgi:hypothetical protein
MISRFISPLTFLVGACVFAVSFWRQSRIRKRMIAMVKLMVEKGKNEIGGHSIDHWLHSLNQDWSDPVIACATTVLRYKAHEFLFVDGGIAYRTGCYHCGGALTSGCHVENACFLVAVGQSAARALSQEEQVFRLTAGTPELAIFSVFRWSAFTKMLTAERR